MQNAEQSSSPDKKPCVKSKEDSNSTEITWHDATMRLYNGCPNRLTDVVIIHSVNNDTTELKVDSLDPGHYSDAISIKFATGFGAGWDYWFAEYYICGFPIQYSGELLCNLTSDDKDGQVKVYLARWPGPTMYFNILPPVSSACNKSLGPYLCDESTFAKGE